MKVTFSRGSGEGSMDRRFNTSQRDNTVAAARREWKPPRTCQLWRRPWRKKGLTRPLASATPQKSHQGACASQARFTSCTMLSTLWEGECKQWNTRERTGVQTIHKQHEGIKIHICVQICLCTLCKWAWGPGNIPQLGRFWGLLCPGMESFLFVGKRKHRTCRMNWW